MRVSDFVWDADDRIQDDCAPASLDSHAPTTLQLFVTMATCERELEADAFAAARAAHEQNKLKTPRPRPRQKIKRHVHVDYEVMCKFVKAAIFYACGAAINFTQAAVPFRYKSRIPILYFDQVLDIWADEKAALFYFSTGMPDVKRTKTIEQLGSTELFCRVVNSTKLNLRQ